MIDKLSASLAKHQLDAKYLAVKVTESAIMQDAEQCIGSLNALKELGIALAIDDFGTGYSSLSYLKRFPLDKIKIDRSFIRDISDDNEDLILTQAIVALATQMNLAVIAEGVETTDQYDILKRIGCHEFQGYLASKPLAAEEIEKVLGQQEFLSAALA
ncbi:MAG TPA: EAL domain-containing protein, partial [Pseudomonadales bacterium]|nr:EAL domain-containing protein [Pseudomonadales bacterium]